MPGVCVGPGVRVRRAIIDENVHIPAAAEIGCDLENDRRRFAVSDGGVVAVSEGMLAQKIDARHTGTNRMQYAGSFV